MNFDLEEPLTSSGADAQDVREAKQALNRLGYYAPDDDIGITAFVDSKLFKAIEAFQRDRKLPVTSSIRPHDDTVIAINRAIEDQPIAQEYIWCTVQDDKVRSSHAVRNGKRFTWLQHPLPGEEFNCRCWAEPVIGKKTVDQIYDPPIKALPYVELGVAAASRVLIGFAAKKAGEKVAERFVCQLERKFTKHANQFGVQEIKTLKISRNSEGP